MTIHSKNPSVGLAIKDLLRRYPAAATRELARLAFIKHPLVFSSLEHARKAVRYYRGTSGVQNRKNHGLSAPLPRLHLPTASTNDHSPFAIDGCRRVLVLSDLHLPYHQRNAIELAVAEGRKSKCDAVLLNGDVMDFHTLSKWEHDPAARQFPEERKIGRQFVEWLRQEFPKARIVFRNGNHEERLRTYLLQRARELYDEEILSIPALLGLDELGIEHVGDKRVVTLGKLPTLHGHELPKGISAPVNPARGAFLRIKGSVLVGHSHRTSEHAEVLEIAQARKLVTAWSQGCLCELRPRYEPYNGWNLGFAVVDVDRGGDYQVRNARIHGGKVFA